MPVEESSVEFVSLQGRNGTARSRIAWLTVAVPEGVHSGGTRNKRTGVTIPWTLVREIAEWRTPIYAVPREVGGGGASVAPRCTVAHINLRRGVANLRDIRPVVSLVDPVGLVFQESEVRLLRCTRNRLAIIAVTLKIRGRDVRNEVCGKGYKT